MTHDRFAVEDGYTSGLDIIVGFAVAYFIYWLITDVVIPAFKPQK